MTRPPKQVLPSRRALVGLAFVVTLAGCVAGGKLTESNTIPSNAETYATLAGLWSGVPPAIGSTREPSTDTFTLQLAHTLSCPRGGHGSYSGTLTGTKSGGVGSATLALTATLAGCQFDDGVTVTEITSPSATITGRVAIVNDLWSSIELRMLAESVVVNGKVCPGGIDVALTGASPASQPVSTGYACGRSGSVVLP